MKLTPFLLDEPAKTGVLIVPGGGYGFLAVEHEGKDIAAWLNAHGYDAWMLEYTIASDQTPAPIFPAPQNDALSAIDEIRAQNRVEKLGIWGFSAGGHLAAMTATEPNVALDFAVLCYPVIDMAGSWTHEGSRNNLLGEIGDPKQLAGMSPHENIDENTPPTFLFHTAEDDGVPPQNSLVFALMLAQNKVPFELHIYEKGAHGVGLAPSDPILSSWGARLEDWLARR